MASIADQLIAAPFAIIGSVGVLAQLPNFNRFLESHGIDFEQITAGKYKRTLSLFGKNTEEDRAKMKEDLKDVHDLFKAVVAEHRPAMDIDSIATGEYWYGSRAKQLGLVDELGSSDDYLMKAAETADIYGVFYQGRPTLLQRLQENTQALIYLFSPAKRRQMYSMPPHRAHGKIQTSLPSGHTPQNMPRA